jgi:hypothetical protein
MVGQKKQSMANVLMVTALALLFVIYTNVRWGSEASAFEKAKETADTPSYVRISGEALLSKRFWANARPPMFPLLLKAYAADKVKVATFQTALSIFAWGILALAVAYSLKAFLRPFAFGLILALSLDRHIAGWDLAMLTESLSVSLMALFLAIWFWLLKNWTWGKMFLLSLVAFLWAFTRDTNGWLLSMISGLIVLGVLLFGARKRYLSLAIVFVILFALSNFSSDKGNRWVFPLQNVLAQRILPDQGAFAFFVDCGLPVTPELLSLEGGFANSNERAFYNEPALQSYRTWLHASGKSCYMRWLLSRPLASLREPWLDLEWLLAFKDVASFYPQRYVPLLPWYMERILYPQDAVLWLWALTTVAALVAVWKKAWKANPAWLLLIGLCLLIYPHLFIVWHGDVPGTHRHALTISLQFVLSFWLLGLLLAERVLAFIQAKDQRLRKA